MLNNLKIKIKIFIIHSIEINLQILNRINTFKYLIINILTIFKILKYFHKQITKTIFQISNIKVFNPINDKIFIM